MAEFLPAYTATMKHEGGYVNNPADHGGETYRGISRNNWRGWNGWPDVDRIKGESPLTPLSKGGDLKPPFVKGPLGPKGGLEGFDALLASNADLQGKVRMFYQRNFWMPTMARLESQELANWLFDKAVNMGVRQAMKLLQRALFVDADGIIGPESLARIAVADPKLLLENCRHEARRFYTNLALKDLTQTRFLQGWLARA
jgi:lysozyme family protein